MRKIPQRKYKLSPWLQHKNSQRLIIAVLTAVFSFLLGERFSGGGHTTSWNAYPAIPASTPAPRLDGTPEEPARLDMDSGSMQLFIAIMTSPASVDPESAVKRQVIRETWLPRVQELPSVAAKFVIGREADSDKQDTLLQEISEHQDEFLTLDVDECKRCGARKMLTMLKEVWETDSPKWFLKVEDSVYVSPGHALRATSQWSGMRAEYVGCLQHGRPVEDVDLEAKQDADRDMITWEYHAHARKGAYAVSGDAVSVALLPNSDVLRMLQHEETSVALWMLAFKVNFWDDMRLCTPACSAAAIAVSNNACDGLCSPQEEMHYFNNDTRCHDSSDGALPYLDSYRENQMFHSMRVYN